MTDMPAHLTVHRRPFCDFTGCMHGHDIAKSAGVHTCEYPTFREACAAAEKLVAVGQMGVSVAMGPCPESGAEADTAPIQADAERIAL